jgi:phosphatidate cytidylyltransferase
MAYFSGMLFGKHKLCPKISPKKTIEGAVGGILLCTLTFIGYGFILNNFLDANTNVITYAILGFFASVVSQLGDLIMSAIKRKHDVKDYGRIFPGHGGVLDRFDSVIAVAPVLYLICYATLL